MANPIKYNTSAETLALKKGNFYIGTGDVGKGPTSSTGYYNGVTPPSGGYTIYLNKASDGPAIYTVSTEAQLTALTNRIAGTNYTTSGQCLNYFATQTDKMIFNRDYEPIVTNGLVMNIDAGFTPSYPTTGTTWYNLGLSGNNGNLINGPIFNPNDSGSIVCDGVDDYVSYSTATLTTFTIDITYSPLVFDTNASNNRYNYILGSFGSNIFCRYNNLNSGNNILLANHSGADIYIGSLGHVVNGIYNIVITFDDSTKNTKVFINSSLVRETTYNATLRYQSSITLGDSFNSKFFNHRVYNRVLTNSEILKNYFATIPIVRNGLVLNLEAGNPTSYFSGSKSWVDTAGGTIGALTNGPTFSSSGASSNIVFDGVDDAVIWNSNPLSSLTSAKTYELWVKFDSSLVNTFTISCGTYMVYLEAKNTWYVNQAGASNAYLSWTFSTGWTNFIYSFDGTNHLCYINGVARTINFGSGVGSQTNLYIGNRVNMDSPMKGNIAITRMYNRALSATEILQNFNAQRTTFGI
jgi:hypothetical protein